MCGKELEYVQQAFASNWIAPIGPQVDAFEKEMCAYTGAPHAAAVVSGTAALHLALILAGVKQGDEVLCSSFTFAGTAFPITYQGATPVFVDSDATSWNMDPDLLDKAVMDRMKKGKKPKACIVVHLYGQSADLDPIAEVCRKHDIVLIEDAAESLGARYKGRHSGTIAALGVLSFNGNKIITTSGGGMLLGVDKDTIDRARFYATQARDPAPHYEHTQIGYNYRMSSIVAAIGRGQLTVIEERVAKRRAIFEHYRASLADLPGIGFMPEPAWSRSNRWLTCITIDPTRTRGVDREKIRLALEAQNIESRPLWKPMHLQPVFAHCPAYTNGVSDALFRDGLCLPSGTAMVEDDLTRVYSVIRTVFGRTTREPKSV
jgi:pyridoxal phosphate-dependent aminotransferase EpsN